MFPHELVCFLEMEKFLFTSVLEKTGKFYICSNVKISATVFNFFPFLSVVHE